MICDYVSSTSQLKGDNICGTNFGILSHNSTCKALFLCMLFTSCGICVSFAEKMSSSENMNLSDRYVMLLDESLKVNQALREQLKERESQTVANIEQLTSKVKA